MYLRSFNISGFKYNSVVLIIFVICLTYLFIRSFEYNVKPTLAPSPTFVTIELPLVQNNTQNKVTLKPKSKINSQESIQNNTKPQSKSYMREIIQNNVVVEAKVEEDEIRPLIFNSPYKKIIAFSLFGNKTLYHKSFGDILRDIQLYYPQFMVRLYTTEENIERLKPLGKKFSNLIFVDSKTLPTSVQKIDPHLWRFYPIGEEGIKVLLIRDTDSRIYQREVDAVQQWLSFSTKTLHMMRDHPFHRFPILAGMWGLRLNANRSSLFRLIRDKLFEISTSCEVVFCDQLVLNRLWYVLSDDKLVHDSYHCAYFKDAIPFPSKRLDRQYVGMKYEGVDNMYLFDNQTCPIECRPIQHLDWEFC